MDRLTKERRSWNMSRIPARDTKPEIVVRSMLHKMGYRFRIQPKGLPGKPDIVLPKYRTAVFVHGCFWHGHENCRDFTPPKTRTEWWLAKINGNRKRDAAIAEQLEQLGWQVLVIWECELTSARRENTVEQLVNRLDGMNERL